MNVVHHVVVVQIVEEDFVQHFVLVIVVQVGIQQWHVMLCVMFGIIAF